MKPRWILFDLGGVLLDWTGAIALRPLLPAPLSDEAYAQRWRTCAATDRFERGQLSPLAFAQQFAADWGVALAPEAMLAHYVAWLRGFYPGARELLAALRPQARLACLSNTNAAHWDSPVGHGVRAEFEVALTSHELGLRKPQPEIFALALQRLAAVSDVGSGGMGSGAMWSGAMWSGDVAPGDVLYFDDLAPNVAAANAAGLHAHHVVGLSELRQRLQSLGVLGG